jgi:hypothetical protein
MATIGIATISFGAIAILAASIFTAAAGITTLLMLTIGIAAIGFEAISLLTIFITATTGITARLAVPGSKCLSLMKSEKCSQNDEQTTQKSFHIRFLKN